MLSLITAATFPQAYRLQRAMNDQDVLLGDPNAPVFNPSILKIPSAGAVTFAHEMLTLCLDKGIGRIFPLMDRELKELQQSLLLFEEYGIEIIIPRPSDQEYGTPSEHALSVNEQPRLMALLKGNLLAGEMPQTGLPGELSGIYEWAEVNGQLNYHLLTI